MRLSGIACLGLMCAVAVACSSDSGGKKKKKKKSSAETVYAEVFPGTLAIASPLAQSTSSTRHTALSRTEGKDFASRRERIQTMLSGTTAADCLAELAMAMGGNGPTCYGPSIYYQNHPDGSPTSGSLPSGDLGIWNAADASGEACIATKMNFEIERAASYVDTGMTAAAMVVCAANVTGSALPAEGETSNLLSALETVIEDAGVENFTPTVATVTQNTPSVGESSYTTTLEATVGTADMTVTITHEPTDSENATFVGEIQITAKVGQSPRNLISVKYEQESDSSLKYEFRKGETTSTDDSTWFSSGVPALPSNGGSGYSWGIFNLDPSDGSGKVAYAWVAGSSNENLRSFIAQTDGDTGTGYFGYGDSLTNVAADSSRAHWLDRMICNWAGPNNNHTGVTKVQRQTLERNAGGMFTASASAIAYAPSLTCNGSGGFSWSSTEGGTYDAFTTSNSLINISELSSGALTVPSAPASL